MLRSFIIITLLFLSKLAADYVNMPIQDFVNIVSSQNSINIATDKKIEKEFSFFINQSIDGRVNISVLEELLDQNGFVLDKKNPNYFIIKSKEEILINKMDIFKLEHADTKKIKSQADLILKSYFKNIKKVRTTTKDKQYTPMQEVDADKSNTKIEEIEEKMEYSIQIIDNKSIAVTYKDHFVPQVLKQIIEATDHMPKRIKVQAKIYEVNTNALKEVGTQFNMSAQAGDFNVGANVNPQTGTVSLGVTETNRPLEIGTVIKALEQNGKAKIHSEPSIFLYEGKAAKLTEGKTYPIEQESTTVSNNTTTQTTKYTYQDTGTIMDISFEEFRSDMIYLKMSLSITDVEKFDTEKNQLITLKRELREDLLLNPSKQIFLAGLSKKTEYKVNGGIPVLKEIPYLGALFEFENMKEEKSMIIISIQADLISPLK